jgi:hypothetical protein
MVDDYSRICVYDNTGRLVIDEYINQNGSIPVRQLNNGNYNVVILTNDNIYHTSFIKY